MGVFVVFMCVNIFLSAHSAFPPGEPEHSHVSRKTDSSTRAERHALSGSQKNMVTVNAGLCHLAVKGGCMQRKDEMMIKTESKEPQARVTSELGNVGFIQQCDHIIVETVTVLMNSHVKKKASSLI